MNSASFGAGIVGPNGVTGVGRTNRPMGARPPMPKVFRRGYDMGGIASPTGGVPVPPPGIASPTGGVPVPPPGIAAPVRLPNGTMVHPDATITMPNGQVIPSSRPAMLTRPGMVASALARQGQQPAGGARQIPTANLNMLAQRLRSINAPMGGAARMAEGGSVDDGGISDAQIKSLIQAIRRDPRSRNRPPPAPMPDMNQTINQGLLDRLRSMNSPLLHIGEGDVVTPDMMSRPPTPYVPPDLSQVQGLYARGGSAHRGGPLTQAADRIASQGRFGDNMMVHVNPREFQQMRQTMGEPHVNPTTGQAEFFGFDDLISSISDLFGGAGDALSSGASAVGDALSSGASAVGDAVSSIPSAVGSGVDWISNALGMTGPTGGAADSGITRELLGPLTSGAADTSSHITQDILNNPNMAATDLGSINQVAESANAVDGITPAGAAGTVTGASDFTPNAKSVVPKAGEVQTPSGNESWLARNARWLLPAALGTASLMSSLKSPNQANPRALAQSALPPGWNTPLPKLNYNRAPINPNVDWYHYGQLPEQQFFGNTALPGMAHGGSTGGKGAVAQAASRHVRGPGAGQDDQIPAMLSDGEYVIDSSTVSDIGDGSNDEGAARLDKLRSMVAKSKGRKATVPPKSKPIEQYAKGARVI